VLNSPIIPIPIIPIPIPIIPHPTHHLSFSYDSSDGSLSLNGPIVTDTIVVDGRNLIHANGHFTSKNKMLPTITTSNIKRSAMKIAAFFAKLKCKKIILVLSQEYTDCEAYAQAFFKQYSFVKNESCASLEIVEYVGAERFTNGDDIIALKLAIKTNGTLVSNDRMNKLEDALIFDKVSLLLNVRVHTQII